MRQYESYVNSGLEWINTIPSYWSTMPLKRYGRFNKGLTFTKADLVEDGNPVVSYGQVHSKINNGTHLSNELIRYVPDKFVSNANNSVVRKGDFIFADTSEDLDGSGNVAYNDKDTVIYGGYHTVLFQTKNDDNRYLAYLFSTDCWRSQVRSRVSGIKVFSITQGILSMTSIILPPEIEQKKMADYLDEKTSQIDSIIRAREKKIQLLEELKASIISNAVTHGVSNSCETKDSGNEWIGMIPSHWDVVQISRVAKVILGKMLSTEKKETFEYLCAKDVHYGTIDISDLKRMFFSKDERELYEVKYGDMLIVEGGAGAGGCAVYKYNKQNVYIQNSIMIIRGKEQILSDYLCSFMQTINQRGYVKYICNTATIPHFSKEKVCSVVIPLPPISEQKQIIDHIIRRTSVINSSIVNAEKEIELLREYRASLITEVVTGKRKVI